MAHGYRAEGRPTRRRMMPRSAGFPCAVTGSGCRGLGSIGIQDRIDEAAAGIRMHEPTGIEHVTQQEEPRHRKAVGKVVGGPCRARFPETGGKWQEPVLPWPARLA